MLTRLVPPENALLTILSPPVITTLVKDAGTVPPNIYLNAVLIVPFKLAPTKGNVMLVRLLQPENAPLPMLVTLSGIVMLVRLVQPENT